MSSKLTMAMSSKLTKEESLSSSLELDSGGTTTNNGSSNNNEGERDEILEVQKMSSKETSRIRTWRIAVTCLLLLTAVAITVTIYMLLDKEETNNFEEAFAQFSRTVADAAIEQQRDLRLSSKAFSEAVTTQAIATNATWPYFYMKGFEKYAENTKLLSRTELVGLNNVVKHEAREEYIEWSGQHYQEWIQEGHMLAYGSLDRLNTDPAKYNDFLSRKDQDAGKFVPDYNRSLYYPRTTMSPPPAAYGPVTNWNLASVPALGSVIDTVMMLRNDSLVSVVRPFSVIPAEEHVQFHSGGADINHPHSFMYTPIYRELGDSTSDIVAIMALIVPWDSSLLYLLPDNVKGIISIIRNDCNQSYTYRIDGHDAFFMGEGEFYDKQFEDMEVAVDLSLHEHPLSKITPGHCQYSMHIFPSQEFADFHDSNRPEIVAAVVACTFVLIAIFFLIYDVMVHQRNEKLVRNAARSNAIVTSLFPGTIRDRLLEQNGSGSGSHRKSKTLKNFLTDGGELDDIASKPLADLFLNTTIVFADIVGFTAWSSVREPFQVFTLLEQVYAAFDEIAKRRRVCKVETVGDCYVAVCGLPEPRSDHASAMARFSRDIMNIMQVVTKRLEVTLGPGTGDLILRVGIHSGPVTAGVLRGERARFQLFGDTMNTCARIESTGKAGRIQVSQETHDHLVKAGKDTWLQKREDAVEAKGKGKMQTYWLTIKSGDAGSVASDVDGPVSSSLIPEFDLAGDEDDTKTRLIDWNVERLSDIIKQIVARRKANQVGSKIKKSKSIVEDSVPEQKKTCPLEEVKEIITLPEFDSEVAGRQESPDKIELSQEVSRQLHAYVSCICSMYRQNSFHNFDHASHVVMSVCKLMSRIVAPSHMEEMEVEGAKHQETLHDHTYGITSDPLTQFACAFSALIHDVDHTGVPNTQLIAENAEIALIYENRSVAEQNSLDLAWELLMSDKYVDLRQTLCSSSSELKRFRQLVVNSVLATDIMDQDLKKLRNARWDKAFKGGDTDELPEAKTDAVNRKATIVIEHLIQASDVAHTMQHWHVYRKWNERLFMEMYKAYKDGRAAKNPAEFWYKGEIGFLDFYVIPLAKKLKDCGVFGVSSDEYLNYAVANRKEWEARGQEALAEMMEKIRISEGRSMSVEYEL